MKRAGNIFFRSLVFAMLLFGCARSSFKQKWLKEESPSNYIARFETTKGIFEVEITQSLGLH
jgi:peptidyl-prolyl cis-trans isomerase A (cyclophilin A)